MEAEAEESEGEERGSGTKTEARPNEEFLDKRPGTKEEKVEGGREISAGAL